MPMLEGVVATLLVCLLSVPLLSFLRRRSRRKARASTCACSHGDLSRHTEIFEKRIIRVKDDVLVAVGYGIANSICVRGETGLVIIDTCESVEAAEECLRDFRSVPGYGDLPIRGILYTHFHTDHVGGTDAYLSEADPDCEIWAHHTTGERMVQFDMVMGPIAYVRAARQFGLFLGGRGLENCGIGPRLRLGAESASSQVLPNREYGRGGESRRVVTIAGLELELVHAPGETEDQTVVFLPRHRILFAADNYYEAFPNLYAIRGAPNRDPMVWADSLDAMRALGADIMVPSHTLPVHGREEVAARLRNYRDAIAYVHDQTVRLALKGHHPDFIANSVRLPAELGGLEYLKEFYGTVHWSVKAIFSGYLGWFSGEPSELFQLEPSERAARMVALGGGGERCLEAAEASMRSGDLRWALELATALVVATLEVPSEVRERATDLRVDALLSLGGRQISANGRNYYLTSALEAGGELKLRVPKRELRHKIMVTPIEGLFRMLSYRVDADAADGENRMLRVSFTDTKKSFLLVLRNSVMTIASKSEQEALLADLGTEWRDSAVSVSVTCSENSWRRFLASPVSFVASWSSGNFKLTEGSVAEFGSFMACLDNTN